jgi:hypothetical protein
VIVVFPELFVYQGRTGIDRQIVVFIGRLEIDEFFVEFFYRIVESGFVFVVVFDDAEFSIGWIIVS